MGGLYAGLAPAVLRHVPYTGIRVLAFEQLRSLAQEHWAPAEVAAAANQPGVARVQPLPLPVRLAIGLTAGGVAQFVAVPADLIKVRMQADGRLVAAGLQTSPRCGLAGHLVLLLCICPCMMRYPAHWRRSRYSAAAVSPTQPLASLVLTAGTAAWCTPSDLWLLRRAFVGCGAARCQRCSARRLSILES